MKLQTKIALFITLSKMVIAVLFVFSLPFIIERIASQYTNFYLKEQRNKVLEMINLNGIDYYLEAEEGYGSYTLLKEEFIALSEAQSAIKKDTIETSLRIIERDTLNYRILAHSFEVGSKNYLLEIGKSINTLDQYNQPLQRIALYVLVGLIFLTLIIDLFFVRYLLKPFKEIIRTKVLNQKFPFSQQQIRIKSSTTDFIYLDESLSDLMKQVNEAFEKEREFTANASHELMTPVSILQHKIENLLDHPDATEALQKHFAELLKSLNRLKKIVNALLLISRIDNDQFFKSEEASLSELIKEVLDEINHRVEVKNITLEQDIATDIILRNINRDLLFQLLYNIINNAIKFNKENGKIGMKAIMIDNQLELRITDEGIGISEQDIPFVFNRFKKNHQEKLDGYGLGLSIAKSIAHFHEIEIGMSSKINQGTTFILKFPVQLIQ